MAERSCRVDARAPTRDSMAEGGVSRTTLYTRRCVGDDEVSHCASESWGVSCTRRRRTRSMSTAVVFPCHVHQCCHDSRQCHSHRVRVASNDEEGVWEVGSVATITGVCSTSRPRRSSHLNSRGETQLMASASRPRILHVATRLLSPRRVAPAAQRNVHARERGRRGHGRRWERNNSGLHPPPTLLAMWTPTLHTLDAVALPCTRHLHGALQRPQYAGLSALQHQPH